MQLLSWLGLSPKTSLPEKWLVIDTETTGLNSKIDRILSIASLPVINNKILISEQWECFIKQNYFNPNAATIHGITRFQKKETLSEFEAMSHFCKMTENVLLVGHHICFDLAFINRALLRNGLPPIENKVLDLTDLYFRLHPLEKMQNHHLPDLDTLCEKLQIKTHGRHTASGDAMITALALIKMIKKTKSKPADLSRLLVKCKKIKKNRFSSS